MNKLLLFFLLLFLISCKKYEQPSEPKLSGRWRIDKVIYQRINDKDTLNQLYYYPGDQYFAPNEDSPLDSIEVGFTEFAMDYSCIYFNSSPTFAGNIKWKDVFFYSVTGVNFSFPGFISFQTETEKKVWKIVYSGVENAIIQLRGQWDPNSLGFYENQTSTNYDDVQIYITRIGP